MIRSSLRGAGVLVLLAAPSVAAQVTDQVVVYMNAVPTVRRFDRKLNALGEATLSGGTLSTLSAAGFDGEGRVWICHDPFEKTELTRLDPNGTVLPPVLLGERPMSVVLAASGTAHALTKASFSTWGPLYAVSAAGAVIGTSSEVSDVFWDTTSFTANLALAPDGSLWAAADRQACPTCGLLPVLVRVDPASGAVVSSLDLSLDYHTERCLAASPDGTLWNLLSPAALVRSDGTSILATFTLAVDAQFGDAQLRVDAAGDLWMLEPDDSQGPPVPVLRRRSAVDGAILAQYPVGDGPNGFALGASGEDAFVVDDDTGNPQFDRLVRINLVTGVRSSRPLPSALNAFHSVPNGDPTGFTYANVVDQAGDADGDGWPNRREVQAGSSPYDPLSRPRGPKAYLSFEPGTNAIVLRLVDPDGLLDPHGGIDLSSIELLAGSHGDVLPLLLPFATAAQISADGTSGTIVFGGLPLAEGLKLPLEARATDRTGAVGWDWAVTPPGDL